MMKIIKTIASISRDHTQYRVTVELADDLLIADGIHLDQMAVIQSAQGMVGATLNHLVKKRLSELNKKGYSK